jgi:hypothetical protein
MNVCIDTTVAVMWHPFAIKGFWALWNNIISFANAVMGGLLYKCNVYNAAPLF